MSKQNNAVKDFLVEIVNRLQLCFEDFGIGVVQTKMQ
jgi:hypothetical protein